MRGSAILAHRVLDVLLMRRMSENCESGTKLAAFSDVRLDEGASLNEYTWMSIRTTDNQQ